MTETSTQASRPAFKTGLPHVAYVLLWYPLFTQPFIFREVEGLKGLLPLSVYSLYGPNLRHCSNEMRAVAGETHTYGIRALGRVLGECFPGGVTHASGVQVWRGARAMLPDGAPAIGPSGTPGVWLNLGHGASGWALACGSARLLADQLAQRTPALPSESWAPQRWQ